MNTFCVIEYLHKMDNINMLSKIARRLSNSWLNEWKMEVDSNIQVRKEKVSVRELANQIMYP